MSLASRENLIRAMVTGRKSAVTHPGARDARRASVAAYVAAILIIAVAVVAVRAYDARNPAAHHGENTGVGSAAHDD